MNVTLAIDEKLVEKGREYARLHGTTLNSLIRDQLAAVVGECDVKDAARKFTYLARNHPGSPDDDFTFDREETHKRGEQ